MITETDDVLELDGFEDELPHVEGDEDEDDAPDDAGENAVIRKMRADLREAKRERAELQRKVDAANAPTLRKEPTLEDHNYVDEEWVADVKKWKDEERDYLAAKVKSEPAKASSNFEASANAFQTARAALTAETPEAEDVILDVDRAFGVERSGFLIHAFKDKAPSLMVAIGKNPNLMDELADMDPVEMIVRVARMQTKEAPMARQKPDIDEPVRGRPATVRGPDKQLEKLEAEAERTRDRTKLLAYKRQQREAGRSV